MSKSSSGRGIEMMDDVILVVSAAGADRSTLCWPDPMVEDKTFSSKNLQLFVAEH